MVFVKNAYLSLMLSQAVFVIFGIWEPNNLNEISRYFFLFYSCLSLFFYNDAIYYYPFITNPDDMHNKSIPVSRCQLDTWQKMIAVPSLRNRNHTLLCFISFIYYTGVYVIIQLGDLIQVWGNLPLMAAAVFLLFTNCVLGIKVINVTLNRKIIQDMLSESNDELTNENRKDGIVLVKRCHKENTRQLIVYFSLAFLTVFSLMSSAEKNQLPLRAWYPYDISKTPSYQLTYAHQVIALAIAAVINVAFDALVTSLISQFRCRLKLLALSLRTLSEGLRVTNKGLLTQFSELIIAERLHHCVIRHKAVLEQVTVLQNCFSTPIFAQFTVSVFIICVTAYQLAFENRNFIQISSMVFYLSAMMMQVFIYCIEGNQLFIDSEGISTAAYESSWYTWNVSIRRQLLMLMTRTLRPARLTAGGITQLSLATFMSIIKASYTFFTVLQQVEES